MAHPLIDAGLAAMAFSRRTVTRLVEDIPQEKYCHQPVSGANHVMWVLGHLADTDDFFLETLGGKPAACPAGWQEKFRMGSKPMPNLSDYPAIEVINQQLHSRREELCAWLSSMNEAELAKPLPKDFEGFAPNMGAMFGAIACHESLHAGQITVIRRSLGMGPKFG